MLLEVIRLAFIFSMFAISISFSMIVFAFTVSILFGTLTMIPGGIGATEISQAAIINNLTTTGFGVLSSAVLIDRFVSYYLLILLGALILMLMKYEQ